MMKAKRKNIQSLINSLTLIKNSGDYSQFEKYLRVNHPLTLQEKKFIVSFLKIKAGSNEFKMLTKISGKIIGERKRINKALKKASPKANVIKPRGKHLKRINAAKKAKNKAFYEANKEAIHSTIKNNGLMKEAMKEAMQTRADQKLGFTVYVSQEEAKRSHKPKEKRNEVNHKILNETIRTKTKTVIKQKHYKTFSKT